VSSRVFASPGSVFGRREKKKKKKKKKKLNNQQLPLIAHFAAPNQ